MVYSAFFQQLAKDSLPPCLAMYGEETYVMESAVDAVRKKYIPDGMQVLNESVLPPQSSGQQVWEDAQQLPVGAEKRIVVIKDWAALTMGDRAPDIEEFVSRLDMLPGSAILLLVLDKKPDKRKKLFAELQKRDWVVEFQPLEENRFFQFVRREVRESGKEIEDQALEFLMENSNGLLLPAIQEVQKAVSFVGDRETITRKDLDQLLTPTLHQTVFDMVNSLCDGKEKQALTLLRRLQEEGTEPMNLLGALNRNYQQLFAAKALLMQRASNERIRQVLEVSPYILRRILARAQKQDLDRLRMCIEEIARTDEEIKTGKMAADAAFDLLFFRLLKTA
ncbi:MAG: DNA polymerase III subunit delta [Clostridia bacterium]|nr:DNA polymerase III subunit delta [Clostridia bacterium]